MLCKNCGMFIVKVVDRWYHSVSGRWFCSTLKAEPDEDI